MIAAFSLLGLFLCQSTSPPDISGDWTGEGWGHVELEERHAGNYDGTYTDTFGKEKGRLRLEWSRAESRYNGTWREGKDRFGKISVRLTDKEIRGAWTTSKKSRIEPGKPELADLLWSRHDPFVGNVALSSGGAPVEGPPGETLPGDVVDLRRRSYMLEFDGRQAYVAIPKLRYDGTYPITLEATVMSLYQGSIIADFSGAGLGLEVSNGYVSFHVNDGRDADNGYVRVKSSISVGRNKPVHIAGVLDGNKLQLFVKGKLQGQETIGEFNKSTFPLMIGADPGGQGEPTKLLNGLIDEVRVSKTARYDKEFSPPSQLNSDTQTLLLYRFDEGEGDVANDASGNGLHGKIHHPKWVVAKTSPRTSDSAIQRFGQIGVTLTEKNGVVTGFALGNCAKITDADMALLKSLGSLEKVVLIGCSNVTDHGFAHLQHLPRLKQLNLSPSNIGDTGLAHVKGMHDLWMLGLNGTRVTDAGLKHLLDNHNITVLYLNNTQITDGGLAFLEQMKNMFWMDLGGTAITDVGLAHLGHMSKMKLLSVDGTRVTDAGLKHLDRFPELELINLNRTAVTDAGIAHLAKLRSIQRLLLSDTDITYACLDHLAKMNLKELQLLNSKIPSACIRELRKKLRKDCKILHSLAP